MSDAYQAGQVSAWLDRAAAPGSAEGTLVVSDIAAAHDGLVGRGIDVSDVCPELTFEIADLLRQRRSGKVKPPRGPTEMEFLGDGDEVGQLVSLMTLGTSIALIALLLFALLVSDGRLALSQRLSSSRVHDL